MWNGIWHRIKTKSVRAYRKNAQSKKNDLVEVVLEMPTEVYSTFRLQLDAPHVLQGRRKDDADASPPVPS